MQKAVGGGMSERAESLKSEKGGKGEGEEEMDM